MSLDSLLQESVDVDDLSFFQDSLSCSYFYHLQSGQHLLYFSSHILFIAVPVLAQVLAKFQFAFVSLADIIILFECLLSFKKCLKFFQFLCFMSQKTQSIISPCKSLTAILIRVKVSLLGGGASKMFCVSPTIWDVRVSIHSIMLALFF